MHTLQGAVPAHGCRKLRTGDYRDVARPFKRLAKRLGGGSLAAGVRAMAAEEKALEEAAVLLEVPPKVGCSFLAACLPGWLAGAVSVR